MRRILLLVLAVCLIFSSLAAQAVSVSDISDSMFLNAKKAIYLLATEDYESIVEILPFSGEGPSAEEWASFAGNFTSLSPDLVQTDISVAYWTGSNWNLAVPVSVPSNGNVEALILISDDGHNFTGYRYSTWSNVSSGYQASDYVVWNKEYVSGNMVIEAD